MVRTDVTILYNVTRPKDALDETQSLVTALRRRWISACVREVQPETHDADALDAAIRDSKIVILIGAVVGSVSREATLVTLQRMQHILAANKHLLVIKVFQHDRYPFSETIWPQLSRKAIAAALCDMYSLSPPLQRVCDALHQRDVHANLPELQQQQHDKVKAAGTTIGSLLEGSVYIDSSKPDRDKKGRLKGLGRTRSTSTIVIPDRMPHMPNATLVLPQLMPPSPASAEAVPREVIGRLLLPLRGIKLAEPTWLPRAALHMGAHDGAGGVAEDCMVDLTTLNSYTPTSVSAAAAAAASAKHSASSQRSSKKKQQKKQKKGKSSSSSAASTTSSSSSSSSPPSSSSSSSSSSSMATSTAQPSLPARPPKSPSLISQLSMTGASPLALLGTTGRASDKMPNTKIVPTALVVLDALASQLTDEGRLPAAIKLPLYALPSSRLVALVSSRPKDSLLCQRVFLLLADRAAKANSEAEELLRCGAIKAVVDALERNHKADTAVHVCACHLLSCVCIGLDDDERVHDVGAEGAAFSVIACMQASPDNEAVQLAGCQALKSITSSFDNARYVVGGDGVEALMDAMRRHPDCARIQAEACLALGAVCESGEDMCARVVSKGALDSVMRVFKQYKADPLVLECACVVITRFAMGTPLCAHLVNANVTPVLVQTIRRHKQHASLAFQATMALLVMGMSLDGERVHRFLASAGAVDVMAALMCLHPGHDILQSFACSLLCLVGRQPTVMQRVLELGVVDLTADALKNHPESFDVQSRACEFLELLITVKTEAALDILHERDVPAALVRALALHSDKADVLEFVLGAIGSMALRHAKCLQRFSELNAQAAVLACMLAMQEDETVARRGSWALLSLSLNRDDSVVTLIEKGASKLLLGVLVRHSTLEEAVIPAINLLILIAERSLLERDNMLRMGVVGFVVTALRALRNVDQLQLCGVQLLTALSGDPHKVVAGLLRHKQGMDLIVACTAAAMGNAEMLGPVCGLLDALACADPFVEAYAATGGVITVLCFLRVNPTDATVNYQALRMLTAILRTTPKQREIVLAHRGLETVHTAAKRFDGHPDVQLQACVTLLYLTTNNPTPLQLRTQLIDLVRDYDDNDNAQADVGDERAVAAEAKEGVAANKGAQHAETAETDATDGDAAASAAEKEGSGDEDEVINWHAVRQDALQWAKKVLQAHKANDRHLIAIRRCISTSTPDLVLG
ncbi:hypothetical protein PTSG_07925 [Salpingoeca rosetta]|uniref:Uncharacterized protein n=1 Tax=Salpingoeca rosetta (strain ATCC 50818 / BSB-021) TaxID=946362 RepID=F2UGQ7_SALR5|nr:uncharacterized protein PTSG_07925 [Salpingoeca rosetta]EGD75807.1 hypothetical protein PTSG_07925 [Salpingoeca rosetta]|eukprot:XP_004991728.1 hypothetical protein PTSG_07925 [Salpingoeca rosetta]